MWWLSFIGRGAPNNHVGFLGQSCRFSGPKGLSLWPKIFYIVDPSHRCTNQSCRCLEVIYLNCFKVTYLSWRYWRSYQSSTDCIYTCQGKYLFELILAIMKVFLRVPTHHKGHFACNHVIMKALWGDWPTLLQSHLPIMKVLKVLPKFNRLYILMSGY